MVRAGGERARTVGRAPGGGAGGNGRRRPANRRRPRLGPALGRRGDGAVRGTPLRSWPGRPLPTSTPAPTSGWRARRVRRHHDPTPGSSVGRRTAWRQRHRRLLESRLASQLYFSSEPHRVEPLAHHATAMARRLDDPRALFAARAMHHDGYVVGQADVAAALAGRPTGRPRPTAPATRPTCWRPGGRGLIDLLGKWGPGRCRRRGRRLRPHRRRAWPAGIPVVAGAVAGHAGAARRTPRRGRGPGGTGLRDRGGTLRVVGPRQPWVPLVLPAPRAGSPGRAGRRRAVVRPGARRHPGRRPVARAPARRTGPPRRGRGPARRNPAADPRLRDRNWPSSWFMLSRATYLVGDEAAAAGLLDVGAAFAGQCVQVSLATVCLGLGRTSPWRGSTTCSVRPRRGRRLQAGREHERSSRGALGGWPRRASDRSAWPAPPILEGAAALLALARASADQLGLGVIAAAWPAPAMASRTAAPFAQGTFRRDGAIWEVTYGDGDRSGAPCQGARRPGGPAAPTGGVSVGVRQLGPAGPARPRRGRAVRRSSTSGPGGPCVLAEHLEDELDDAEAANDLGRAERAREERDELIDTVTSGLGLGGRSRRLDDPMERARKTVTARIRNSIERLDRLHPALARHLDRAVDTGSWCADPPSSRWNGSGDDCRCRARTSRCSASTGDQPDPGGHCDRRHQHHQSTRWRPTRRRPTRRRPTRHRPGRGRALHAPGHR